MRKLDLLLNHYTFINFKFIWKLFLRYRITSIVTILIVFSTLVYRYSLQRDIYHITTHFQMRDDESSSPTSAIASLLGEKTSRVSHNFVVTMENSTDFLYTLAEEVQKNEKLYELNLNKLNAKQIMSTRKMLSHCNGEAKCEVRTLKVILPQFFSINEDEIVGNWYHLNVKTLDQSTTKTLVREIVKAIRIHREHVISGHLKEQVRITDELIHKKKEEIGHLDIEKKLEKRERIKEDLQLLAKQGEIYSKELTQLKIKLKSLEESTKRTSSIAGHRLSSEDEYKLKKYLLLKDQINRLRFDINALELSLKDTPSEQTSSLLTELNKSLKTKEKEYSKLQKIFGKMENAKVFSEKKRKLALEERNEYFILKTQVQNIQEDYDALLENKDKLIVEMTSLEEFFKKNKPDIEYLKLLEEKKMKLNILRSTVVTDISFDKNISDVYKYKKASKIRTVLYSLVLSFFALILVLSVRYYFDDKIYDGNELQAQFGDLKIIGDAPQF